MKRALCLLLFACCLVSLCGCSVSASGGEDSVAFYYRRADFQYHGAENVIVPEQRDISGHRGDLQYLIALYLLGPLDDSLVLPFPKGTRLLELEASGERLQLTLSDKAEALSDSAFTLASTCLSLTCLSISEAEEVTIICAERSITIRDDNLLLTDDVGLLPDTTEEST